MNSFKDIESFSTPLEHPHTVMFPKGEYYKRDITENVVYRYYKSVASKIVEELNGDNLMVIIRVDGKDIIKKHLKNDISTVRTPEEFNDLVNTGRMIEVHRIFNEKEPFAVVDVDPRPKVSFEKTKEVTEDLTKELTKLDDVQNIQVYFSGNRGFHVYANFSSPKPVNKTKDKLKSILYEYILKKKDPKIMLDLPKNDDEIRLDITIFHPGGSIRLPYSLHKKTGLAAVPVKDIRNFTPEMAKINKFLKVAYSLIKDPVTDEQAIGFDFDNTIFKIYGSDPYVGEVDPKIAQLMRNAKNAGYKVIIFTARIVDRPQDIDFIIDICDQYDLPYDEITSEKKPEMVLFYDDKAINPKDIDNIFPIRASKLKTTGDPPPGVSKSQFPRETKNYLRYRQFNPSKCKPGTFWVKKLNNGDQLVICELKSTGQEAVQSKLVRKKKKKKGNI